MIDHLKGLRVVNVNIAMPIRWDGDRPETTLIPPRAGEHNGQIAFFYIRDPTARESSSSNGHVTCRKERLPPPTSRSLRLERPTWAQI